MRYMETSTMPMDKYESTNFTKVGKSVDFKKTKRRTEHGLAFINDEQDDEPYITRTELLLGVFVAFAGSGMVVFLVNWL